MIKGKLPNKCHMTINCCTCCTHEDASLRISSSRLSLCSHYCYLTHAWQSTYHRNVHPTRRDKAHRLTYSDIIDNDIHILISDVIISPSMFLFTFYLQLYLKSINRNYVSMHCCSTHQGAILQILTSTIGTVLVEWQS